MRALALFSGGLDSSVAIHVVKQQGIEIIALNFVSYFFGGVNPNIEKMAQQLDVKLEFIDFKEAQKILVKNPPSGYGKNMNPCIDCHALMLRTAKGLLEKYDAQFIITGEVLGQRPMSQNAIALKRVEKIGEVKGLVVRPMSAKLMPITTPEELGWINRSELLSISGRSRKDQMEYAERHGIVEYPSPGGGCLLTDPNFSKRLKAMKEDDDFEQTQFFEVIKQGRFIRFAPGRYLVAGRLKEENEKLYKYKNDYYFVKGGTTPGPGERVDTCYFFTLFTS
ncbi:MAG: 7-cyano-7-deazaguanine synthase [Fusobacteria bacterium]|nr:7-cyano-7-deazaguanine synthase [Fusobacteriota bacterium]